MRYLWITGFALVLDQITKLWVQQTMALYQSIPVLGSFFKLTYIHNPGGVFGMRLGNPYVHLALAGVALVFVCVLLWRLPPGDRLSGIGLGLVLGGAIGNIIDRVRLGEVIDFLDFGLGTMRWWIFNLADMYVSVGAGLLILSYGVVHRDEKKSDDADRTVRT